ncbi:hypothetical protein XM38_034220 [Halomicronema hongdechloris C2206]|uniref:Uncharacterized protein n=1 Tax=Halomicronema hongdechloris C2206 TaxID=1641165 RepID=A0A1Z3HQ93_9CYAN|nr:hypothetical protein [Halomicronema hongdechloris]ASC72465.1 hypothetical protein XM38_034220 [Halomicronema hongdechloris C2206]
MVAPCCLLPSALGEIMAQVADTRALTLTDRYGLRTAILSSTLDDEERAAIDRLLWATRRGLIVPSPQ